ncbi:MAG: PhnD/SsuA/transferrin family substrate-binding protein [Gammaproteobacteria bacterium]|nr:PhnD/SsuA/transferrin family substrate-binding protein [Gammaproteobacteria bacterium]
MQLANLAWYDFDELRSATDRFWSELAAALVRRGMSDVPLTLERNISYREQWRSPRFLFGQACGLDLFMPTSAALIRPLAAPVYEFPGCDNGGYRSFVVVAADSQYTSVDQLRGHRCGVNGPESHSGMNAMSQVLSEYGGPRDFFSRVLLSGSHEGSLAGIAAGEFEVAAIDCISFAHLKRRPAFANKFRIIARSASVLAPPVRYLCVHNTNRCASIASRLARGRITGAPCAWSECSADSDTSGIRPN